MGDIKLYFILGISYVAPVFLLLSYLTQIYTVFAIGFFALWATMIVLIVMTIMLLLNYIISKASPEVIRDKIHERIEYEDGFITSLVVTYKHFNNPLKPTVLNTGVLSTLPICILFGDIVLIGISITCIIFYLIFNLLTNLFIEKIFNLIN